MGGEGTVDFREERHRLDPLDCLYVGPENPSVEFHSENLSNLAKCYLVSILVEGDIPRQLSPVMSQTVYG